MMNGRVSEYIDVAAEGLLGLLSLPHLVSSGLVLSTLVLSALSELRLVAGQTLAG